MTMELLNRQVECAFPDDCSGKLLLEYPSFYKMRAKMFSQE